MIENAIEELMERRNLSEESARAALKDIMEGRASETQISAFLVALKLKGETSEEIVGLARCMREECIRINPCVEGLLDTCGTGGDRIKTFNVSTTSMFVVAGAGVSIAKHGNRSVTSSAGSADVLEALGINVDMDPQKVEESIKKIGIGFMFAPNFHPAMRHAMPVRKALRMRTVFNILGPLSNPAGAKRQVLGVFTPEILEKMAYALKSLGTEHSFVIHGSGMDEATTLGKTMVAEVDGGVRFYELTPKDFGLGMSKLEDLKGSDAKGNARILHDILSGKKGPKRDIVIANAALGIMAGDLAKDKRKASEIAEESIDSGRALKKLELLVKECGDKAKLEEFGE